MSMPNSPQKALWHKVQGSIRYRFEREPELLRTLPLKTQREAFRQLSRYYSVEDLAARSGLTAKTVRHLIRQAERARGSRPPPADPTPGVGTVSASPTHTGPGEPEIFLVGEVATGTRMHACTPSRTHASKAEDLSPAGLCNLLQKVGAKK